MAFSITRFFLTCAGVVVASLTPLFAQSGRDRAVEISATVQEVPPRIVLQWNVASAPLAEQKVYRRLKDAAEWSEIATPANAATSFTDTRIPGLMAFKSAMSWARSSIE